MRRRTFLQAAAVSALAANAQDAAPGQAPAEGIRLGFDTYSLRAFRWKDVQFIDYAKGLGLDTVQRIVKKHRGNIQVTSKPGDTCFQVWLPVA